MTNERPGEVQREVAAMPGGRLGRMLRYLTRGVPRAAIAIVAVATLVHPTDGGAALVAIGVGAGAGAFIALGGRAVRTRADNPMRTAEPGP